MTIPLQTTIHPIDDHSQWPAECISLCHQFTPQLRGELPTQPLSPLVQNILEEVKESPRISFTDQGDLQHALSITDYLDSVLTSVRMFRELKALDKNEGFGPRATKPIWSSLIASLSTAWSKDVSVLSDVPFLLPRSLELSLPHIESGCVEGCASLLLCTSISTGENDLDDDIIEQDAQDVKEEECSEDDDQPEQDDFADQSLMSDEDEDQTRSFQWAELSVRSLDENDLDGSSSAISLPSLNLPFDAHILPGQGRRTNVFLPIICIAEEQDIFSLVTSAVYQRHLWGISRPIIGISLSKFGTTANVMLGWISPHDTDVDQQLPQVHIALGNRQGDESLGIFNLLEPVSTLYFAQFILNMSSELQSLSESLQTTTTTQLCWRLDHLCLKDRSIMHESEASDNWFTRVEQWALDVALSESSEHPPFSPAPLDGAQEEMAEDRRRRKPVAKVAKEAPVISSKEALSVKSTTLASQSSGKLSNMPSSKPDSASKFAGHHVEAGVVHMESGYELWAWNRRCVRIGRLFVSPAAVGSAVEQINDMVNLYNSLTNFAWPQDWTDVNRMPNVDAVYLSRRQQLYDQFQSAKKEQFNSCLDIVSTKLLGSRFSTFFHAVETAASLQEMRKTGLNIYEKETRNTWDTLLYLFCCSEDVAVSKSVLLERTVRYPRSKFIPSQVTADQYLSISYSQADHQRSIATRQWLLCADNEVKETSSENVFTVLSQCDSIYHHFNKINATSIKPDQLVKAMAKDPTNGTTDAVLCVQIPVTSSQKPPESGAVSILTNLMASSSLFSLMKGAIASSFSLGNTCSAEDKHKKCFMCPAVTDSFASHIILHSVPQKPETALLVPVFFAEYKKIKDEVEKAFNQCRMYCVSGVEFLSTLGVDDFPVFGLVTTGSQGTILMVWKSTRVVNPKDDSTRRIKADQAQASSYTYIMDHNLASFDISIPIQAMQFVITVHRIYQYQLRLKDLLKMSDVYSKMADATFNDWMMKPPVPEVDAKGKAATSNAVA
ncbi:unnamed protein product [Cyclocybe aegerita]|uniref:Uncharacterized protein n=1 Tax=Cyclocybe aegerita TaxID=1973307 RepID=A0A8S0XQS0_CYCAE|nr:unnamed protein product [Cyclocybe aegerita]